MAPIFYILVLPLFNAFVIQRRMVMPPFECLPFWGNEESGDIIVYEPQTIKHDVGLK